jgi:hypothetical protein
MRCQPHSIGAAMFSAERWRRLGRKLRLGRRANSFHLRAVDGVGAAGRQGG